MPRNVSPLGAWGCGVLAGIAGTAAMDLVWYARYRRSGGEDGFADWEFSSGLKDWDDAPAPAQVGKRLVEGLFQRELPPETAGFVNNAAHWATGVGWGSLFGLVAGSVRPSVVRNGFALGPTAWAASYVVLPLAKLYKPMWEYDARTLGRDLSAHLAFGLGTAVAFRALARR